MIDDFMKREELVHKAMLAMQSQYDCSRCRGPALILRDRTSMGLAFAIVAKNDLKGPMHFDWAGGVAVIAMASNEGHRNFSNRLKQIALEL